MNYKEIRARAGRLIRESGMEASELARVLGYPENTVREWLHQGRDPQLERARAIVSRLGAARPAIPGESLIPNTPPGYMDPRTPGEAPPVGGELRYAGPASAWADVPVLGTVAASADGKRGCAVHLDVCAISPALDEFRVEVLSDSMRELARPGQFLRVSISQPVRDGDLVIADLSDEGSDGEWIFKRYEVQDGKRWLRSVNPDGEHIALDRLPRRWYRVRGVEFP